VKQAGLDPNDTTAVATSQARDAENGNEFFSQVYKETAFQFQILSGGDEARLTFIGALSEQDPKACVVIDIGGGSTELMGQLGGQSLDVGSVRFTERYLPSNPVTDTEFATCLAAIDEELAQMKSWCQSLGNGVELIAVAGTATTISAVLQDLKQFDREKIDGFHLTKTELEQLVEKFRQATHEERTQMGVEPGRADVILAGAMILWRAHVVLGFDYSIVSTRGLRYGVLTL